MKNSWKKSFNYWTHFSSVAEANAAAKNTSYASELRNKRLKEKQKNMFRAIKWTLQDKQVTTSISEVVKIIDEKEISITKKEEIEREIIQANDQKYRQTNDTPFMTDILPDEGFLGDTLSSKLILQGE